MLVEFEKHLEENDLDNTNTSVVEDFYYITVRDSTLEIYNRNEDSFNLEEQREYGNKWHAKEDFLELSDRFVTKEDVEEFIEDK